MTSRIFLFFLLLFTCIAGHAEATAEQRILDLLSSAESNRVKNPAQFRADINQLLSLEKQMLPEQQETFKFFRGYNYAFEGQSTKAMQIYDELIAGAKDPLVKHRALVSAANLLAIRRNYEKSLDYLDRAMVSVEQIDSKTIRHQLWATAAVIYNLFEDYDLSLNFVNLIINDDVQDEYYRCAAYNIKIRIELKQELVTATDTAIDDVINTCNEAGLNFFSLYIVTGQAEYFLNKDQPADAITALKAYFHEAQAIGHANLISFYNHLFAQAHWALNNRPQAAEYALNAVSVGREGDFNIQIVKSYELLYRYYLSLGDYESALEYHEKYSQADKANLDDTIAKNMAYQVARHRNIETAQRVKLLSQENELLTLQKDLSKKRADNIKLLLILLSVLVGLVILWAYKIKKRDKFLEKQAALDHLTNIFNRKGMEEYMSLNLAKSKDKKVIVSFAIFDLDLFKNINDEYGHMVGDWVIKKVTRVCSKLGGKSFVLGRLGGEEFCITVINSSAIELRDFCNRCRLAVQEIDTSETGHNFTISASFGVTSTSISGYSYSDLLTDADAAMYKAKRQGRNQVALFSNKLRAVN